MVWEELLILLASNLVRILPGVADIPALGLLPQVSLVPPAFLAALEASGFHQAQTQGVRGWARLAAPARLELPRVMRSLQRGQRPMALGGLTSRGRGEKHSALPPSCDLGASTGRTRWRWRSDGRFCTRGESQWLGTRRLLLQIFRFPCSVFSQFPWPL